MAANQGLYNGFLVAGLIWGALASDPVGFQVRVFFLACVIVAGVYGAATVNRRILFVQGVPTRSATLAVVAARERGSLSQVPGSRRTYKPVACVANAARHSLEGDQMRLLGFFRRQSVGSFFHPRRDVKKVMAAGRFLRGWLLRHRQPRPSVATLDTPRAARVVK